MIKLRFRGVEAEASTPAEAATLLRQLGFAGAPSTAGSASDGVDLPDDGDDTANPWNSKIVARLKGRISEKAVLLLDELAKAGTELPATEIVKALGVTHARGIGPIRSSVKDNAKNMGCPDPFTSSTSNDGAPKYGLDKRFVKIWIANEPF